MNLTGRLPYERSHPVKDPVLYRDWAFAHPFCQACGIGATMAARLRWPGLSTHHMVKQGRSDEPTVLLRLCQRDHDLAEGRTVKAPGGEPYPILTLGVCLSLKLASEPHDLDLPRLLKLRGCALPDFEPIPAFLQEEWYRFRRTCERRMLPWR